jgi:hypothetical protein
MLQVVNMIRLSQMRIDQLANFLDTGTIVSQTLQRLCISEGAPLERLSGMCGSTVTGQASHG